MEFSLYSAQKHWPVSPVPLFALWAVRVGEVELGTLREVQREHRVVRHARQRCHLRREGQQSRQLRACKTPS